MAKNDFKAFAAGDNANVLSQEDYETLAVRLSGFQSGVAKSAQLNKVWRQSSIMSAILAQFIVDQTGRDVIDDGNTDTLAADLKAAVFNDTTLTGQPTAPTPDANDNSTRVATTAFVREEGDGRYARINGNVVENFSVASAMQPSHAVSLGQFVNSFSGSGYAKLPGGFIFQWGSAAVPPKSSSLVTFPIAFPNNVFGVTTGTRMLNTATVTVSVGVSMVPTLSGFTFYNTNTVGATSAFWFSWGS